MKSAANPALGAAVDLLVRHGGTAILSETPEIYGGELGLSGHRAQVGHERHQQARQETADLEARIQSFEMGFRMQAEAAVLGHDLTAFGMVADRAAGVGAEAALARTLGDLLRQHPGQRRCRGCCGIALHQHQVRLLLDDPRRRQRTVAFDLHAQSVGLQVFTGQFGQTLVVLDYQYLPGFLLHG